jgi:hypothetical protein
MNIKDWIYCKNKIMPNTTNIYISTKDLVEKYCEIKGKLFKNYDETKFITECEKAFSRTNHYLDW